MKMMTKTLLALSAAIVAVPASAATLFDGGLPNSTTFRGPGSGPGQSIAVTTATTLTNIGFYSASPDGGNVKYLIFDSTGANLLFSITGAGSVGSTPTLVKSPTFSFNLLAGNSYQFGIISDAGLNVGFNFPPSFVSMNGLTSFGVNHNYAGFDDPAFVGDALASIPVVLDGFQGAAVPEPATWALMILGFGAVGGAMRRRRTSATVRFA